MTVANAVLTATWVAFLRGLLETAREENLAAYDLGVLQAERELRLRDLYDPFGSAYVLRFEYDALRSVAAITASRVQGLMHEAVLRGWGQDALSERLGAILRLPRYRLDVIARTETNRAANWGRYQGWQRSGVVREKIFHAHLDGRVRPGHAAAHGDVVPVASVFTEGDAQGHHAPPIAPNCRCTMLPVTRLRREADPDFEDDLRRERDDHLADLELAANAFVHGIIKQEARHAAALRRVFDRYEADLRRAIRATAPRVDVPVLVDG